MVTTHGYKMYFIRGLNALGSVLLTLILLCVWLRFSYEVSGRKTHVGLKDSRRNLPQALYEG